MSPRLATAEYWGIPAERTPVFMMGWGDVQSDVKGVQIGSSLATPAITGILAAHAASTAAATGASASILGLAPALAVPLIGAALLGATILVTELIKNSGCGQTCVVTSQWANQAAAALQQNSDAYFALPAPRTKAQQGVALANFDAIWKALQQQCGQPGTGDAGKRCISDRERGACTWHQTKSGGHPGEPAIGECWNWFNGYRDPIANDSAVANDSPLDAVSAAFDGASGSSILPLLAIAGLVALGVAL